MPCPVGQSAPELLEQMADALQARHWTVRREAGKLVFEAVADGEPPTYLDIDRLRFRPGETTLSLSDWTWTLKVHRP